MESLSCGRLSLCGNRRLGAAFVRRTRQAGVARHRPAVTHGPRQHLIGAKSPECDEQLARQGDDHCFARGATAIGRAGLVPLGQCAVLLNRRKRQASWIIPRRTRALPALASPCSARFSQSRQRCASAPMRRPRTRCPSTYTSQPDPVPHVEVALMRDRHREDEFVEGRQGSQP
jgi:hypothetical protein